MRKTEFIKHLHDQGCYEIDDLHPEGFLIFRNCINGSTLVISDEEEFSPTTFFGAFIQLSISSPFSYEDEFEVFKLFWHKRNAQFQEISKSIDK
jgi:hypothetical protein